MAGRNIRFERVFRSLSSTRRATIPFFVSNRKPFATDICRHGKSRKSKLGKVDYEMHRRDFFRFLGGTATAIVTPRDWPSLLSANALESNTSNYAQFLCSSRV
jgi:hypothetical protein